jgi:small-conductance mechanosensitive channel
MNILEWLSANWTIIAIPVAVFLAFLIIALWIRKSVFNLLEKWLFKISREGGELISHTLRSPFFHWFLIMGAYAAIQISVLPTAAKAITAKILLSLFIISLFWVIANIVEKLLQRYLAKAKLNRISFRVIFNTVRTVLIVTGVLILLDVWGAPTTPLLLIIAILIMVAILAARELLLNVFSGFELERGDIVKKGDYVKLSSGEQGYISDITWRNTIIKALDDSIIVVPNSKLVQSTITNYGRPLKQATDPFQFYTRLHLKELTGKKARNLPELLETLKEMPDSVIYYHTHHFLEEFQFLTPEPANDFALWVNDAIDDPILSEKLANIDTFEFNNIRDLKARIASVIDEHIKKSPGSRNAPDGREFHFIKSISVILPTQYIAHDLREFIEILRNITIDSLYFHTFESRLRLEKGVNDFSIWLQDSLGENDLAAQIAYLDPYNLTLENLRTSIIQLIEKRIK